MGLSLAFLPIVRIFFGVVFGLIPPEAKVAEFVTVDNSEMKGKNKEQFEAINGLTCLKVTRVGKLCENLELKQNAAGSIGATFTHHMNRCCNRSRSELALVRVNWETTGGRCAGKSTGNITEETEIYIFHSLVQPHLPVSGAISIIIVKGKERKAIKKANERATRSRWHTATSKIEVTFHFVSIPLNSPYVNNSTWLFQLVT
jgi:hypothetical protein